MSTPTIKPLPNQLNYPTPLVTAAATIQGNIRGQLSLIDGSSVKRNPHGIDVLIRKFKGFTQEIYGLLPHEGEADKYMKGMRCVDYQVTEGKGMMSEAMVTYKGVATTTKPKPVISGGWKEVTVQLTAIPGDAKTVWQDFSALTASTNGGNFLQQFNADITGQASANQQKLESLDKSALSEVNVTYRSPTTTILWVSRSRPSGPKYGGYLLGYNLAFSVVDVRPCSFQGAVLYAVVIRTKQFDTVKSGGWWEITEQNAGELVSTAIGLGFAPGNDFPVKASIITNPNIFR